MKLTFMAIPTTSLTIKENWKKYTMKKLRRLNWTENDFLKAKNAIEIRIRIN